MKSEVIGMVVFIFYLIFITNCPSFAGMEKIVMPEATIIAKGKLSDTCMINSKLILNDPDLNASLIADYAVWRKPCNNFLENLSNPNTSSLELLFAIQGDGRFFFGCNGPLIDALNVIGTLYSGEISSYANNWQEDDGKFEPRDIALVGMGWRELKGLQDRGYISGLPATINNFRTTSSIEVKYSPQHQYRNKKIIVLYYPIFIAEDSGGINLNTRWCQFLSVSNNGIAMRTCELEYSGAVASYVYGAVANNSNEESRIRLDEKEILRQDDDGSQTIGVYNIYPRKIELGAKKTWSYVASSVTITVIAESVTIKTWDEAPNVGRRSNPPPDILVLEPDIWYGDFLHAPEIPKVNEMITFDAYSHCVDPNNEIFQYTWHFGDGVSIEGIKATHTYQTPGNYTVALDKVDTSGNVTTYQDCITIDTSNCSSIMQIMKDAKLIETVQTYSQMDPNAILKDPDYYARRKVNDFAVWEEKLNEIYDASIDVSLLYAINKHGNFYVGAMGPDTDVLSMLTYGGITTPSTWGYPILEGKELTDPWIKLDDKANRLAQLLGNYILAFKEAGYMKGGPELVHSIYGPDSFWEGSGKALLDLDRLNFRLINRFDKPVTILFSGIYMRHSDYEFCCGGLFAPSWSSEVHNWPIHVARHDNWNPRPNDTIHAASYRWFTLNYEGEREASFVTVNVAPDNFNEGYVKFNNELEPFLYKKDHPGESRSKANIYPQDVELYFRSHWSGHRTSFKIAVLGCEIEYSDANEISYDYSGNEIQAPSMDGNPPPFIWKISPADNPCLIINDIFPYQFNETDTYIYLYGTVSMNDQSFTPGDMVYIFAQGVDINNGCIGSAPITEKGEYVVRIFADDPTTELKDGACPGDALNFKIFDRSDDEIINLYPPNWEMVKWPESEQFYLNVNLSHEFEIEPQKSINCGPIERWDYGIINCVENIKNQFAYCGTEQGLLIIDVKEPHIPKDVAFLDIGEVHDIKLTESKNYLIVAMGTSGVSFFEVDPNNPERLSYIGLLDTFEDAKGITLSGSYGYIEDPLKGMVIIDISDIKRPVYIGLYSNEEIFENNKIEDLCISGEYAYIAQGAKGLVIVDISNPAIPEYVSGFDISKHVYAVKNVVQNEKNYAYIAYGGGGGLGIIDVTTPNSPEYAGGIEHAWNSVSDIDIINDCVLIACSSEGLTIFDISNPNRPVYGGRFKTTGIPEDISVIENYAYVAVSEGGLVIFDISDPIGPLYCGKFDDNIQLTYDVTVSDNYAYVVDEYKGLMVLDITDPNDPEYIEYSFFDDMSQFLGNLIKDDTYFNDYYLKGIQFHDVKITDTHAYVIYNNIILFNNIERAGMDYSGILVVDISDKSKPHIKGIGLTSPAGMPNGLEIKGKYAYVAEGYYGLAIFDISDPSKPVWIDSNFYSQGLQGLFIEGNYAYLACGENGIQIVDISDLTKPNLPLAGSFDTSDLALNLYVSEGKAYIADGHDGLVILDVSDPAAPVYLGGCDTPLHYCDDVVVEGDYAFIADNFNGLTVIDVSNPLNPKYSGGYDRLNNKIYGFNGNRARGIEVNNNYAYIANDKHGLSIVNIENPTGLQYHGRLDTSGYNKNIIIDGDYAYMANGYKGLSILHISDPTGPKYIGGFDTYGFALDLDIQGNYAYIANDNRGLTVIDITTTHAPNLTANLDTEGPALSIAVKDNYAYVAAGKYGLIIADISNPNQVKNLSSLDTEGFTLDVEVNGNHAYVADYQNGLVVIDISEPITPKFSSKVYVPSGARDIYLDENYAYIIDGDSGFGIFDIRDPNHPHYLSRYQLSEYPIRVSVSGEYAYVVTNNGGFTVINITDPENPIFAGDYESAGYAENILISKDHAYMADGKNGLLEFKIDFKPEVKGNLVLCAGGGAGADNTLWPVTQELANNVFSLFRENGYEVFDIWYQNPVHSQNIDDNPFYDKYIVDDSTPTKSGLEKAIREWAIEQGANTGPLYIFLTGHGAEDRFQIMPNEIITANELKECIKEFQIQTDYKRQVVVVIESAASGTFIDDLIAENEIVIASSNEGPSYIKPDEEADLPYRSFTTAFMKELEPYLRSTDVADNKPAIVMENMKKAFIGAREEMKVWAKDGLPFSDQAPQMGIPGNIYTSLSFSLNGQTPLEYLYIDTNRQDEPYQLTLIGMEDPNQYVPITSHNIVFCSSDPNILDVIPDDIQVEYDAHGIPWYTICPEMNGLVTLNAHADPSKDADFLLSAKLNLEVSIQGFDYSVGTRKMAIIIPGYIEKTDDLCKVTFKIAQHAYQKLRGMGYMKDEIYYYNPINEDIDNNGLKDDIAGYPYKYIFDPHSSESPFYKITHEQERVTELFLFLIDHGEPDTFFLNPRETLEVGELIEQLTPVMERVDERIIFLYDACYSGSFLNTMKEVITSDKLVLITSADSHQTANFISEMVCFSHPFLDELYLNHNLEDAYKYAKQFLPSIHQTPLLFVRDQDKLVNKETLYYVDESRPIIDEVEAYRQQDDTLYITADAYSLFGINNVWAIVGNTENALPHTFGEEKTYVPEYLFESSAPTAYGGTYTLHIPDPSPHETGITIYATDNRKGPKQKITSHKTFIRSSIDNTMAFIIASNPECFPWEDHHEYTRRKTQPGRIKEILRKKGFGEGSGEIKEINSLDMMQEHTYSAEEQRVFIYLIGQVKLQENGVPRFYFNPNDSFTPKEFHDALPVTSDQKLLVLMDSPYAQQFLDPHFSSINWDGNWVGIASTHKERLFFPIKDDPSLFFPSFSEIFFSSILSGANVARSYSAAKDMTSFTQQHPVLFPNYKDKEELNKCLSYTFGYSPMPGEDYSLFVQCNAEVEHKADTRHYRFSLTPTPDAHLNPLVMLIDSPSSLHESSAVSLKKREGESLYSAEVDCVGIEDECWRAYKAYFIVEGYIDGEAEDDEIWIEWKEIPIVEVNASITEDEYEPDNDPYEIIQDQNHEIYVNDSSAQRHTFYCEEASDDREGEDIDWVYFNAKEGHIYRFEAQDLSSGYDYFIELQVILYDHESGQLDYTTHSIIDYYIPQFHCKKSGLYLLGAKLATSISHDGVVYALAVYEDTRIGEDVYEPDDDPYLIINNITHEYDINVSPSHEHTFYCEDISDDQECHDSDWIYFDGEEGYVYRIEAKDSENRYNINLELTFYDSVNNRVDPNWPPMYNENILVFECKKQGRYLLGASLASSYPDGGVAYTVKIYGTQAGNVIAGVSGRVVNTRNEGIDDLKIWIGDAGGFMKASTVNILGISDGGYFYKSGFTYNQSTFYIKVGASDSSDPNTNILKEFDYDSLKPYSSKNKEKVLKIEENIEIKSENQSSIICQLPLSQGINLFYFPSIMEVTDIGDIAPRCKINYYDVSKNSWEEGSGIKANHFNAIYTPEVGYISLYRKSDSQQTNSAKPILWLQGFIDTGCEDPKEVDITNCLPDELFDPDAFDPNDPDAAQKILNSQDIQMIVERDAQDYSWGSCYRLFEKSFDEDKSWGEDIVFRPYNVYIVIKR